MAYNPYKTMNDIAYLKKVYESGNDQDKQFAQKEAQKYYGDLESQGYGDVANQLRGLNSLQANEFKNNSPYKTWGKTPLRATAEGMGESVGWNDTTKRATVGGYGVDMNKFENIGGTLYGSEKDVADTVYRGQMSNALKSYQDQLNKIKTQKYDPTTDSSFQAYKKQMEDSSKRAFNESIGRLAGLTGGIASTAALGTAQQGRDEFLNKISSALPEFEQRAREKEVSNLQNELGKLQALQQIRNAQTGEDVNIAQLTGDLYGSPTMQKQGQQFTQGMADKQYDLEVDRFNKTYDLQTKQLAEQIRQNVFNNGLDNARIEIDKMLANNTITKTTADILLGQAQLAESVRSNKSQEAISRTNAGTSAFNASINQQQLNWAKDPNNPDNRYKIAQIDALSNKTPTGGLNLDDYKGAILKNPNLFDAENSQIINPQGTRQYILGLNLPDSQTDQLLNYFGMSTK